MREAMQRLSGERKAISVGLLAGPCSVRARLCIGTAYRNVLRDVRRFLAVDASPLRMPD